MYSFPSSLLWSSCLNTLPAMSFQEECQNYIRVLLVGGDRLFTCGTNAFTPVCTNRTVRLLMEFSHILIQGKSKHSVKSLVLNVFLFSKKFLFNQKKRLVSNWINIGCIDLLLITLLYKDLVIITACWITFKYTFTLFLPAFFFSPLMTLNIILNIFFFLILLYCRDTVRY